jgi:hypothetical protein
MTGWHESKASKIEHGRTVPSEPDIGVRADLFAPHLPPLMPYRRNAIMAFDDHDLRHGIACELLMRLHDVRPAVTGGGAP